jgi:hypothetical protein
MLRLEREPLVSAIEYYCHSGLLYPSMSFHAPVTPSLLLCYGNDDVAAYRIQTKEEMYASQ